ncbi:MAG: stage II sporulation protein D [Clostridia bacterium]|nr:stage II sporulation protein D [Clostridia bacterium]
MNKGTIISIIIFLVFTISIPFAAFLFNDEDIDIIPKTNKTSGVVFDVYLPDTQEVKTYTAEEYLFGVVAGEMDITFEEEALKAQTVAAYSLALYRKEKREKSPDESIMNADVTADSRIDQAFLTKEQVKEKWGSNYEQYSKKLEGIISSVQGKYLTYKGEIAQTVYHDTSSGKTETAENMWGSAIEYLVSVQSVGDILSPQYLTKISVPNDEFVRLLSENEVEISANKLKTEIEIASRTESGTVLSVKFGEKSLKGTKIREIFNLRSANFDISFADNKVEFTVRGYGHGVGMSQYGANEMAKQGSSFEDILKWYYKGCEISQKTL